MDISTVFGPFIRRPGWRTTIATMVALLGVAAVLVASGGPAAAAPGEPAPPASGTGLTSSADGMRAAAVPPVAANIVAAHSRKCLDVVGGPGAVGNNLAETNQWECLGSGQTNQLFDFVASEFVDGHYYMNIKTRGGKCLDVAGGPTAFQDGARIQLYTCLGPTQHNQQWRLEPHPHSTDRWNIVARHSNKCLDVTGGNLAFADGIRLQQHECLSEYQLNQYWVIYL